MTMTFNPVAVAVIAIGALVYSSLVHAATLNWCCTTSACDGLKLTADSRARMQGNFVLCPATAAIPALCAQYQHGVIPHAASNADRVRAWKCDIWRRTADQREWAAQREEWRKQELELG